VSDRVRRYKRPRPEARLSQAQIVPRLESARFSKSVPTHPSRWSTRRPASRCDRNDASALIGCVVWRRLSRCLVRQGRRRRSGAPERTAEWRPAAIASEALSRVSAAAGRLTDRLADQCPLKDLSPAVAHGCRRDFIEQSRVAMAPGPAARLLVVVQLDSERGLDRAAADRRFRHRAAVSTCARSRP
jgi:hypothetical protein